MTKGSTVQSIPVRIRLTHDEHVAYEEIRLLRGDARFNTYLQACLQLREEFLDKVQPGDSVCICAGEEILMRIPMEELTARDTPPHNKTDKIIPANFNINVYQRVYSMIQKANEESIQAEIRSALRMGKWFFDSFEHAGDTVIIRRKNNTTSEMEECDELLSPKSLNPISLYREIKGKVLTDEEKSSLFSLIFSVVVPPIIFFFLGVPVLLLLIFLGIIFVVLAGFLHFFVRTVKKRHAVIKKYAEKELIQQ